MHRQSTQPTEIVIDDAGVEIKDLLVDFAAKAGTEKTGTIHAWLHSPQLFAGGLNVAGTLTPGPQSLAADVQVAGDHIQTAPLAPYLKPFGIEPTLRMARSRCTPKSEQSGVTTTH